LTKYLIGVFGALLGALGGAWLMLAPFALAYQPSGADWADPTYADFWTGLPLVVVSLIGLIAYVLGLVGELRRRGIIERRTEPQAQQIQAVGMLAGNAQGDSQVNMEQVLLPLLTAMLKDMQDRERERTGGAPHTSTQQQGAVGEEQRSQQ
jgi:hypothetical protein